MQLAPQIEVIDMELPATWQDWVIAIGQLLFFIALLPSVFSPQKPHWASSLMTGTVLFAFAFTFYTLDLAWGAFTALLVGCTWFVLFGQHASFWRKYGKENRNC